MATTRSLTHGASAAVVLVGAATLLGWWLDIEPLKRGIGDAVAMNPATAASFILTGASLWLARTEPMPPRTRRWAAALAAVVALVAIVRLAGYVLGAEVGVDQLLFRERLAHAGVGSPNRMAPNTALCFFLAGVAVLVLDVETGRGRRPAQFLGLVIGAIALQALVGYVYGAVFVVGTRSFIPMAFNTAAAFLVLSAGVLDARDSLPAALRSATALFAELPAAAQRFGTLAPMAQDGMAVFSHTVGLDKTGNRAGAIQIVRQGRGKALMDAIRDTINALLAEDDARASRLDARATTADRLAIVTNVGAGLVAMAFLVGAVLTINRDITRREQAEAALRESERQLAAQYRRLEELEGLRDNLVHMLVHDLRSPLTAIRANLDLIQLDAADALTPELAESIDHTRTAAIRMTDMVGDVLDVSRMEAGQLPLERAELDL